MARKRKNKVYPKSLRDQARRMARGGRTSRQISRDIDVPKRIVKEWTAPEREMRKRVRAKRMKELGRNPSQIAARLNIRVKDVERLLAEARDGDPAVSGGCGARHGTDTRKCVRRMAELQDPVSDMAFIVGVTPKTIRNWIRRIEHDEKKSLLPGGRRRTHDRQAILEDLRATDDAGQPRYTRAQIRDKHGCSHKFLSQLANGRIDP